MSERVREFPGPEEEVRQLREYLRELEVILEGIVFYPDGILPGRHHALLRAAWPDAEKRFGELRHGLTLNTHPQLKDVGLSGAPLMFELAVFYHARDALLDRAPWLIASHQAPDGPPLPLPMVPSWSLPKPEQGGKGKRAWRWIRRLARRFLKAGDVILDSLGKIPILGLPAEGIKQYKEGIEQAAALSEEVAIPPD